MSAFGIFALILTTAYIIYFAVTISRDVVAGRKKAEDSPESETFEISSQPHEESVTQTQQESVAVYETENGFTVGDAEIHTEKMLASNNVQEQIEVTENTPEIQESEQLIESITSGAEDITDQVNYEERLNDERFEQFLAQKSNSHSHLFKRIAVEAEEPLQSEADDGPELQAEQEEEREERDWM